jgi:hypothetical protein
MRTRHAHGRAKAMIAAMGLQVADGAWRALARMRARTHEDKVCSAFDTNMTG